MVDIMMKLNLVKTSAREPSLKAEKIMPINDAHQVIKRIKGREKKMMATSKSIAHYDNLKHYIDGIALQAHHTVIYGVSGSFKTTFITALCFKALKDDPAIVVHYWGFDVSPPYVQAVVKLINELKFNDRFYLFNNSTITDMKTYYRDYLESNISMDNVIIVLDTFKFLSKKINNKDDNKDAMHYIKSICKLGASWISIAHANKDGQNQSGTAEIEQDSDGLLRIDSVIDKDKGKGIANIKKGGRCRWGDTNLTIETVITKEDKKNPSLFWYHAIKNANVIDNVNIGKLKALNTQATDMKIIATMITDYRIKNQLDIGHTELLKQIKENEMLDLSKAESTTILKNGNGKHWETQQDKTANNKICYMAIS